jgi:hypothetical protein
VWVELGGHRDPDAIATALAREFPTVHRFADCDFFFGGVHVVARSAAGELAGLGDARRAGAVARA